MSPAVASLVECCGVVAGVCETGENVPPGIGQFGEAMDAEDEGWAGVAEVFGDGLEDVEVQRSGFDEAGCYTVREC